jgi:hypothetical protein
VTKRILNVMSCHVMSCLVFSVYLHILSLNYSLGFDEILYWWFSLKVPKQISYFTSAKSQILNLSKSTLHTKMWYSSYNIDVNEILQFFFPDRFWYD